MNESRSANPPTYSAIQIGVIVVVLLTGPLLPALQAVTNGVSSDATGALAVALSMAFMVSFIQLAPMFVLSKRPEGLLHPLILVALLWPMTLQLAGFAETVLSLLNGFEGGLLRPPQFAALPEYRENDLWLAMAKHDALVAVSLICLYLGYFLASRGVASTNRMSRAGYTSGLRNVALTVCALVVLSLAVFMVLQGGLLAHLASLAQGRARALEGLGPVVVAFDLGVVAVMLWIAWKPKAATNPLFIASVLAMVIVQFISNGSRSSAVFALASVAITWSLRTGKLPQRLAGVVIPLGIVALFVLAIIRSSGAYGQTAVEALQEMEMSAVTERMRTEVESRQYLNGGVPLVVESERFEGPLLGSTYFAAVVAWVPRPLWEDKPRGAGSRFTQIAYNTDRDGFAVPIGAVAESYWNFGFAGVVLLHLLHGYLLARLHRWWHRSRDAFVTVAFALFLTQFSFTTDVLVPWMQKMAGLGLIFAIVVGLGIRRSIGQTIARARGHRAVGVRAHPAFF